MMVHYHGRWYLNASLPTLYNLQKVPMVECSVYKSLRRKCDALHEDEREELGNEAFALMDSSAAAHAAEIEALSKRVENETDMRLMERLESSNRERS